MDIPNNLVAETKKPEFWMEDYWNAWNSHRIQIFLARESGETEFIEDIANSPVQTFPEYVSDKEYYGKKCDFSIIPKAFISKIDRLATVYNKLITRDNLDYDRLERLIYMARNVIYQDKP